MVFFYKTDLFFGLNHSFFSWNYWFWWEILNWRLLTHFFWGGSQNQESPLKTNKQTIFFKFQISKSFPLWYLIFHASMKKIHHPKHLKTIYSKQLFQQKQVNWKGYFPVGGTNLVIIVLRVTWCQHFFTGDSRSLGKKSKCIAQIYNLS